MLPDHRLNPATYASCFYLRRSLSIPFLSPSSAERVTTQQICFRPPGLLACLPFPLWCQIFQKSPSIGVGRVQERVILFRSGIKFSLHQLCRTFLSPHHRTRTPPSPTIFPTPIISHTHTHSPTYTTELVFTPKQATPFYLSKQSQFHSSFSEKQLQPLGIQRG